MSNKEITKVFVDKLILGITIGTTSWILGIFTNQLKTEPIIEAKRAENIRLQKDVENLEWGINYYSDQDFY